MNPVFECWLENRGMFPGLSAERWLDLVLDEVKYDKDGTSVVWSWSVHEIAEARDMFKHPAFGKKTFKG